MKRALVTGGGGFLGRRLVEGLIERGIAVRSFSRGAYPELDAMGVEVRRGDLGDVWAVREAVASCDTVFHVAAKPGIWGSRESYYEANVRGTENVLSACQSEGISRLIYTSSPSVTFSGEDQSGVDESAPYPDRFLAHYPRTKARAEQLVRAANGPQLATVSLRPHLIWGPRDPHLVPRLVERAKKGQLRLIGRRSPLIDSVYVDNAAEAHLLAADRLKVGSPIAGKVYFITNGEPLPIDELINGILEARGVEPVTKRIPFGVAYAAGSVLETVYRALGREDEPRMTRFLALQLAKDHWFPMDAARRDLGYVPSVSIAEGLRRLRDS